MAQDAETKELQNPKPLHSRHPTRTHLFGAALDLTDRAMARHAPVAAFGRIPPPKSPGLEALGAASSPGVDQTVRCDCMGIPSFVSFRVKQ